MDHSLSTASTCDLNSGSTPPSDPSRRRSSASIFRPSEQPSINDLKLSHILNGETCAPISFADFATFIANKEFTSENLLFVIWYRSYRIRFDVLPKEKRDKVPVPSTKLGDRYRPFGYLDGVSRDFKTDDVGSSPIEGSEAGSLAYQPRAGSLPTFGPCEWTKDGNCQCGDTAHRHGSKLFRKGPTTPIKPVLAPPPIIHSHLHPPLPPAGTVFDKPEDQPMRDEAVRAFTTFLKKGGSRELGISDELRQYAKTCLQRSSAPEVFQPIYEEVYQTLENQSLPHFLTYAKHNINRPKQLFWYWVGFTDFMIGIIIFLILTLLLSSRHFSYRAIRLPSTIFIWFGSAQMYSAYRGFCNQVWGRSSMQLKPWEMDEADEEALIDTPLPTPLGLDSPIDPISSKGIEIQQTESIASDMVFTPEVKLSEFSLPTEVYPLTDLTGATSPSSHVEELPWAAQLRVEDDELPEATRRRLAVRRETIKVPDASLAFPIHQGPTPPISPARSARSSRKEISPFDFHEEAAPPLPDPNSERLDVQAATSRQGSPIELGGLLSSFERRERLDKNEPGKKPKMFGPERVVQDPRMRALYSSIVRDITIVASIMGVIWVGVCFAVPNAGLA